MNSLLYLLWSLSVNLHLQQSTSGKESWNNKAREIRRNQNKNRRELWNMKKDPVAQQNSYMFGDLRRHHPLVSLPHGSHVICKRLLLKTFFFQCITVLEGKQHCRVPVNFQWTVPWVQIRLKHIEMKSQSINPNLFKSAFKSLQCWAMWHWKCRSLSPILSPPAPRGAEGCNTLEQQARVLHQREVGKDKGQEREVPVIPLPTIGAK